MASGLTCRLALACARPTASILPIVATLLDRNFVAEKPDQSLPGAGRGLVADMTDILTGEGWLYLAVSFDRVTRKLLARRCASICAPNLTWPD